MKRFFLISLFLLAACGIAPEAVPPTVTPPTVAPVDLETLLIQAGDLPSSFVGGQVKDTVTALLQSMPSASKALYQSDDTLQFQPSPERTILAHLVIVLSATSPPADCIKAQHAIASMGCPNNMCAT